MFNGWMILGGGWNLLVVFLRLATPQGQAVVVMVIMVMMVVMVMVYHVVVLTTTGLGRMMRSLNHERGLCIGLGATKCVSFRNGDPAFVSRFIWGCFGGRKL